MDCLPLYRPKYGSSDTIDGTECLHKRGHYLTIRHLGHVSDPTYAQKSDVYDRRGNAAATVCKKHVCNAGTVLPSLAFATLTLIYNLSLFLPVGLSFCSHFFLIKLRVEGVRRVSGALDFAKLSHN